MVTMTNIDIKKGYFDYLVEKVCDKKHKRVDYIPLLDLLHSIPFTVVIEMDENRVNDGAFLRERYLQSEDLYAYLYEFDDEKVSCLEVLIGIADRLEYEVGNIMEGDHTSDRFWLLLRNLDIEKYTSDNYKPLVVKEKVRNWMMLKYKKNGVGSIFPVKHSQKNMKSLQICDQMSIYIEENW